MSTASVRDRLRAVVEPPVVGLGYDLEDIVVTPAGKRRLVRVVVDRDGGVSLDQVDDVSPAVSEALADDADVLGVVPYVLKRPSPGVVGLLPAARVWRRARGRLVRVDLVD